MFPVGAWVTLTCEKTRLSHARALVAPGRHAIWRDRRTSTKSSQPPGSLFVPQSVDGIDAARSHRRQPYCNQRDDHQYDRYYEKNEEIPRLYTK